jgi:hypothetical protein
MGGGQSNILQALQQIEMGYKMLASALPSLAPIAAEGISKLRVAVPGAMSAGANAQGNGSMQGDIPPSAGPQQLPSPPAQ